MAFNALAQEPVKSSCSQKLKEMQKSYEQGVLATIPEALSDCMAGGFNKTEKLQAYRLVILSYLFLDETKNAQQAMNDLLVYEPDYQPNKALDPVEYTKLFNSFSVLPYISFGVSIGANQSLVNVGTAYGVGNTEANPVKFTNGIGLNFGACIDVLLYKNLFLATEATYYTKSFKSSQTILNASSLNATESQTSINVPITIKYVIGSRKLRAFLRGGIGIDLLLNATNDMVRENTITSQDDFAGPGVDMSTQRNKLNLSAIAGGGITYKLGYGFAFVDARYIHGLTNYSNAKVRYDYFDDQISNYGYIDPDFGVNNIQISIGYMYSMYRVKKKRSNFIQD